MSTATTEKTTAPAVSGRQIRMTLGLVAAVYVVYLTLVQADGFAEYLVDTSPTADPPWQFFYYFTNQSNLLVIVFLVAFAIANLGDGRLAHAARRVTSQGIVLGLTLYMLVVFIVVTCILDPFYTGAFSPVPTGSGLYVHVISPILMLGLYLVYPWPGRTTWRTVLAWMGYLLFYVVLANVVGATVRWPDGTRAYPYDFLNPHGYGSIVAYGVTIVGLAAGCFLLGLGLMHVKRRFDAGFRPVAAA